MTTPDKNTQFSSDQSALLQQIMNARRDVRSNRFLPTAISKSATDDIFSAALSAPQDRELIAYLCVGYVDKFYGKPELELETLQWEVRDL